MVDTRFTHLPRRWQACIAAFLQRPPSVKTRQDYCTYLVGVFSDPERAPDQFTAREIAAYVESPSKVGIPGAGLRHHRRATLSMFYDFACEYVPTGETEPIIGHNPASELIAPRQYSRTPAEPFAHLSRNWQACIEQFIQHIASISGSTQSPAGYRSVLARFFATNPTKSPEDFTRQDVRMWLTVPSTAARNHRESLAAATSNSRLGALVSFYRWASAYEVDGEPIFLKKSPTDGIAFLKPGRPQRAMSTSELRRFFAAIPRDTVHGLRDFALMGLYFWSTRRASEISRLLWKDIEFTTIVESNGTRREGIVFHYSSKGHAREQLTQEMPIEAWRAIDAYLIASGRKDDIQPDDPLFAPLNDARTGKDHTAKRTLHPCYVNLIFKAIVRKAGLDCDRFSLHSLRHTGATERWAAGVDLRSLQRILGHSSIATTDRYIAHLTGVSDEGSRLLSARLGDL